MFVKRMNGWSSHSLRKEIEVKNRDEMCSGCHYVFGYVLVGRVA